MVQDYGKMGRRDIHPLHMCVLRSLWTRLTCRITQCTQLNDWRQRMGRQRSVKEFICLRMTGWQDKTNIHIYFYYRLKGWCNWLPYPILASKWIHFIDPFLALLFRDCWTPYPNFECLWWRGRVKWSYWVQPRPAGTNPLLPILWKFYRLAFTSL